MSIKEKYRLEFRAEFFNAFNSPHFDNPNTVLGNANYGRVTSTAFPAREIQLGIKLLF
jgi:hypothetical protein